MQNFGIISVNKLKKTRQTMNIQISMEWHDGEVLMRYVEVLIRQMINEYKGRLADDMLRIELEELQKKLYTRLNTTPKNKKINVN